MLNIKCHIAVGQVVGFATDNYEKMVTFQLIPLVRRADYFIAPKIHDPLELNGTSFYREPFRNSSWTELEEIFNDPEQSKHIFFIP